MDYELLCKRLIGAMQYGIRIESADGHRWVRCDETIYDFEFHKKLTDCGISFNNKSYGGYIETLDTIDRALAMMKLNSLEQNCWMFDDISVPHDCTDRIDVVEKNNGGLY